MLALAGCATVPPEEDPVQIRLNDLDTRLAKIERVVTNQSLLELSQRIDALQAEVRTLRGQTEELDNGTEAARKQQRDLYADLDKRLAALESGGAARYDAVFCDVVMPGGASGFDVARWVAAHAPHLRVLLTSGYPDEVASGSTGDIASLPLLRKPYSRIELARALRQVLDADA